MKSINKTLSGNIVSLFTLKGAEYIVSFITLPYLLRVLGPEHYGMVVFAQTVMNYGSLLVDYGFNLTAPRDIAKAEKKDVPLHFSAILTARLLLLIFGIVLGSIAVYVFSDWLDTYLILCVLPAAIGTAIFPIWYYQGIQQMRFITIFNIVAKTIAVMGIFLFVQDESDYYQAAFLQSVTPFLAGVISLGMLCCSSRTLFLIPTREDVWEKLKDGWEIFCSTLFISLYTNSNIFILRILTDF